MISGVLVPYVLLKFAAYAVWCGLGVRLRYSAKTSDVVAAGVGLGLLRVLMGFVVGLGILHLVNQLYARDPRPDSFSIYLIAYVPVRVLEWWALWLLISIGAPERFRRRVSWRRSALWILGGIAVSCLADIPVFAAIGSFPVGRFWC